MGKLLSVVRFLGANDLLGEGSEAGSALNAAPSLKIIDSIFIMVLLLDIQLQNQHL